MATIAQLRSGLKTRLQTISGLRVYETWPDSLNVPAAIIKRERGSFYTTLGGNSALLFTITAVVQLQGGGLDRAQEALDEYTDVSGTKSIKVAIEGDESLGGTAEYLLIGDWGGDDTAEINGMEYAIAQLPLEVHRV